jgi:hypothetical protein
MFIPFICEKEKGQKFHSTRLGRILFFILLEEIIKKFILNLL